MKLTLFERLDTLQGSYLSSTALRAAKHRLLQNNYAAETTYQNIYMSFGGTNWGNLAEPTVYTSLASPFSRHILHYHSLFS
jgi:hypothetical protein